MGGMSEGSPSDQQVEQPTEPREDPRKGSNRLFSERLAMAFRFDDISDRLLGEPEHAPYLFLLAVVMIDLPILSTIEYLQTGYNPLALNPLIVLNPIGFLYGIWAARRIRQKYTEAFPTSEQDSDEGSQLLDEDNVINADSFDPSLSVFERALFRVYDTLGSGSAPADPESRFETIAPYRLKYGLLVFGWGLHLTWILLDPDALTLIFELGSPLIGSIKFFGLVPLVYYPIGVDVAATFLGVLVFLPFKLRRRGPVDFEDPLGYGGLKPVGGLISSATLLYLVAFTAWALVAGVGTTLGKEGLPQTVSTVTQAYMAIGVLVGVGLFALATLSVHRLMKSAKHWRIEQIAKRVREEGPEDDSAMFPDTSVPRSADDASRYMQLHIHMTKVDNMREYPINMSNVQDILFAAILPYLTSLTWNFIVQFLQ